MKSIILLRNLDNNEDQQIIEKALSETRADFAVDINKKCVIIEGNNDMVAIARKVLVDEGFKLL